MLSCSSSVQFRAVFEKDVLAVSRRASSIVTTPPSSLVLPFLFFLSRLVYLFLRCALYTLLRDVSAPWRQSVLAFLKKKMLLVSSCWNQALNCHRSRRVKQAAAHASNSHLYGTYTTVAKNLKSSPRCKSKPRGGLLHVVAYVGTASTKNSTEMLNFPCRFKKLLRNSNVWKKSC